MKFDASIDLVAAHLRNGWNRRLLFCGCGRRLKACRESSMCPWPRVATLPRFDGSDFTSRAATVRASLPAPFYALVFLIGLGACDRPKLPLDARSGLDTHWVSSDGRYHYPPRSGFADAPSAMVLPPGMLIDRF